jgi:glyceraldehyde-3-phosphate dehydrogenase/erythrose-4-phosphate dehydrogenase
MAEHKQEEGILKEFLIERVKSYEAIWDTYNANHVKVTVVTNCWLEIIQELKDEFADSGSGDLLKCHSLADLKKVKAERQKLCTQYRANKSKTIGKSGDSASNVIQVLKAHSQINNILTLLNANECKSHLRLGL